MAGRFCDCAGHVHGGAGYEHRQRSDSGNDERVRGVDGRNPMGRDQLHIDDGRRHSAGRLSRHPVRDQKKLPRQPVFVHARLAVVRPGGQQRHDDRRTDRPGGRRRTDDDDRSVDDPACRAAGKNGASDGSVRHLGFRRSRCRADAQRVFRGAARLAFHFYGEHSVRDVGDASGLAFFAGKRGEPQAAV